MLSNTFEKFSTSLKVVIIFFVIIIVWMLSGVFSGKESAAKVDKDNKHANYKIID